jgi:hypothetical protein
MEQHLVVNQDKNPAMRPCESFKSKVEYKKVGMTHVAKLQKKVRMEEVLSAFTTHIEHQDIR